MLAVARHPSRASSHADPANRTHPMALTEEIRGQLLERGSVILEEGGLRCETPSVYILVGAGVSMASAGLPSWRGLIDCGCSFARQCRPDRETDIAAIERLAEQWKLVEAAEGLRRLLNESQFREYFEIVFRPYGDNRELIRSRTLYALLSALRSRGARLLTVNYDTIIEDVLCLHPMDWTDPDVAKFLDPHETVKNNRVLHLHGLWDRPADAIFGESDYNALQQHRPSQERVVMTLKQSLESLFRRHRVLFIGCGDTLSDPHLGPLVKLVNTLQPDRLQHVIHLCSDCDYEKLTSNASTMPAWINPVPYGHHTDPNALPAALRRLFPAVFRDLDQAVTQLRQHKASQQRRYDREIALRTNFPVGEVFVFPDDGLIDDYNAFAEYYHIQARRFSSGSLRQLTDT